MKAEHLEFLVEEPSAEAFLVELLPRLLDGRATFTIHAHQGKSDLIGKLAGRLRGYAKWLPEIVRIVVLVDLDDDNCDALKQKMEQYAKTAGLRTRTSAGEAPWRVVNRIELRSLKPGSLASGLRFGTRILGYPRASQGKLPIGCLTQSLAERGKRWNAF